MATPMPVQANVNYLTVPQVAEQLGTTPLHILRLIAREKLKAVRAGSEIFDFKVFAVELDRYLSAGSHDFESVKFDEKGSEIQSHDLESQASRFVTLCANLMAEAAPEELPEELQADRQPIMTIRPSAEIRALIASPPNFGIAGLIRIEGQKKTSQFKTLGEFYAAKEIRASAMYLADRSAMKNLIGMTRLKALYASADDYRRITAEAIERFKARFVHGKKTYPGGKTLSLRISNADLGIDLASVVAATF